MKPLKTLFDGEDCRGELCAEARAVVRELHVPDAPPPEQTDVAAAREQNILGPYDVDMPPGDTRVDEREIEADGRRVRVRIYAPPGDGPFPVLVFAHGGCWTICSLDSHDRLCRYFSCHAACVVVSVDYSLAPEKPFPAGLDDYCAAVAWCFDHAGEIGGDAARIAVAGDSAGGNLAAVAARRFAGSPDRRLCLQLLIYPICDVSGFTGGSMDRYAGGYFFERAFLEWTTSLYTRDTDAAHPDVSPLSGPVDPRLAPALILLAECDILRDQGLAYAAKLHAAGVRVTCRCYRGVPHAFVAMAGVLSQGRTALMDASVDLREGFEQT